MKFWFSFLVFLVTWISWWMLSYFGFKSDAIHRLSLKALLLWLINLKINNVISLSIHKPNVSFCLMNCVLFSSWTSSCPHVVYQQHTGWLLNAIQFWIWKPHGIWDEGKRLQVMYDLSLHDCELFVIGYPWMFLEYYPQNVSMSNKRRKIWTRLQKNPIL